jgi:hypothetical protein
VDNGSQGRPSTQFRIGWWALVILSAALALNHLAGIAWFSENDDDRLLFAVFAGLNVYALAVLLRAFRRRERWAWLVTWVSVVVLGVTIAFAGPEIGIYYLFAAGVMAVAQLLTMSGFSRR